MTKRKHLTAVQRSRIFDAQSGICHICECKIAVGERWDVDHIKPLWLGGDDTEWNMAPAHLRCHSDKTKQETPVRAKSNRVRAKHLGIRKPSRWPKRKMRAR